MATEIEIVDLTNGSLVNQEWAGTGVFDTLIAAVNKNIELQYNRGRITGQDYANVYLGAMQAVLGQSIEFLLRKDLTEAQVSDVMKGIELKDAQIEGIGYDNQVKVEQVRMSQFEREFIQPKQLEKIDAEIGSISKDNDVKDEQIIMSRFEREFIQPKQLAKLEAEIGSISKDNLVKDQQILMTQFEREFIQPKQLEEVEAKIVSMEKDNLVKEEQVKMSVFEREFVQPAQLSKLQKDIEVAERQVVIQENKLEDDLLTSEKQRVLLDTQEEGEQFKVDYVLPKELENIDKDIETKERQMVLQESKLTDDLLTAAKQRTILDTEEQAKQYEVDNILPANLAVLQKQDDELRTKIELMAQQKLTEVEQTRGANASADKVEYEVSNLLPLQKADAEEVVKLRRTEKIGKDKEVAALGLDNVVKQSETSRSANPSFVYTPRYTEV
jgi:hypothetical protein